MFLYCLIQCCLVLNGLLSSCIVPFGPESPFKDLYGFVWRCMLFCNTVGCLIILFGPVGFPWSGFVLYDLLQQCLLLLGIFRHSLNLRSCLVLYTFLHPNMIFHGFVQSSRFLCGVHYTLAFFCACLVMHTGVHKRIIYSFCSISLVTNMLEG